MLRHDTHGKLRLNDLRRVALCAAMCIAMPLYAAESVPLAPTDAIANGRWIKLDTYLKTHRDTAPAKAQWPGAADNATALPSLGIDKSDQPVVTQAAPSSVRFAPLPPMFDRNKPQIVEKTRKKPVATPDIAPAVPEPVQPEPPVKPTLSPQAAAAEGDRRTLDALRQAVQDLHLEQELDFLHGAQKAAAPTAPEKNKAGN